MDLNKYDYKRFEQLLEEMIREEVEKRGTSKSYDEKQYYQKRADTIEDALILIKERQQIGKVITSHVINSKDAGHLFKGNWLEIKP